MHVRGKSGAEFSADYQRIFCSYSIGGFIEDLCFSFRLGLLVTTRVSARVLFQLGGLLRTYVLDSACLLLPECLRESYLTVFQDSGLDGY